VQAASVLGCHLVISHLRLVPAGVAIVLGGVVPDQGHLVVVGRHLLVHVVLRLVSHHVPMVLMIVVHG